MQAARLGVGDSQELFAVAGSVVRGREQKTSFHVLGTGWVQDENLASPAFLCLAQRGRFSVPANLNPRIVQKRRSVIAQATATWRRRRH
jgi:hypothetical protein